MLFLQQYGVSPAFAQKIFKMYGSASVQRVKDNPYSLAKDILGIGFYKTADSVAPQRMGHALTSPERISAGIEYVLWAYPKTATCAILSKHLFRKRKRSLKLTNHSSNNS